MVISQLINILTDIYNNFGDLNINIYYDPRQSESLVKDPNGINIDDAKTLQIDGESVNIMNMYSWISEYNGCRGEVYYNPDTKLYEGKIIPNEYIEGFNTSFTSVDKYSIEEIFKKAVDEYNDFMGNAKIIKTMHAVNEIINDTNEDQDLDYGELKDVSEECESSVDDEDDYGEV